MSSRAGVNALHRLLQFLYNLAKRRIQDRVPGDNHVIVSSPRAIRSRHPDRFPQTALYSIALHGIADPFGYRKAKPADFLFG